MMSRNFTPEQILIDKLSGDDTNALKELSRRYSYSLYTYCQKALNSEQDAKRIVRNIFIELWEERHSLPQNFSLPVYLSIQVRKAAQQHASAITNKINETIVRGLDIKKDRQIGQPIIDSYKINAMCGLL